MLELSFKTNNSHRMPEIASYSIGKCIGVGQYGKVFSALHKKTATPVALKLINLSGRTKQDIKALRDEIICHRRLLHPNIVRCLDSFVTRENEEVAVITELCPQGDLMEALKLVGSFDEDRVKDFAGALVAGLEFLHVKQGIVHRDLKLQNILISSTGTLKICDFGFAQLFEPAGKLTLTSVKGTPIYMAPELIEEKPYTHLVDLWALGIMLFELRTGKPPFYTTNIFKLIEMILNEPVVFPPEIGSCFRDYVGGLLTKSPESRLCWPAVMQHPFLIPSETTEKPQMTSSEKRGRPTTTDSGIDVASARLKSGKEREDTVRVWTEVEGLDIVAQTIENESTQDEVVPVDWNKLLTATKSQKTIKAITNDIEAINQLFACICLVPTSYSLPQLDQTKVELKSALLVFSRILVMLSTRTVNSLNLHFKKLIVWSSGLVHGLLQLDSQTDSYNLEISELLELTLQLTVDTGKCISNLSTSEAMDITLLSSTFVQMHLTLISRILYSSVKPVDASTASSIANLQNDKWIGILMPALKATGIVFDLIRHIPAMEDRTRLLEEIGELGIIYTLFDFLKEFWDGSRARMILADAIVDVVDSFVKAADCSTEPYCHLWENDVGKKWVLQSDRALESVESGLLMNSLFGLKVLSGGLMDGRKTNQAISILSKLVQFSWKLKAELRQQSAFTAFLVYEAAKGSYLSLHAINSIEEFEIKESTAFVNGILGQVVDQRSSVALKCSQMRLLVTMLPESAFGLLVEVFERAFMDVDFMEVEIEPNCQWRKDLMLTLRAFLAENYHNNFFQDTMEKLLLIEEDLAFLLASKDFQKLNFGKNNAETICRILCNRMGHIRDIPIKQLKRLCADSTLYVPMKLMFEDS
ncbi:Pkinase-domain-containing protein [Rhizoclosmatium globosum]|uniref:non-specific serine/threonine protein kinase n=1 Tax=Rhizoclosmatium globosum TaxID=329046 RepID=A0A1Y2BP11_9FUNG|nr:Pkinase-domain-containing protein [Rhizoclosmatium globosum]|eukprot:ORY36478.1 Pkinase-domain-containing protein [Rhizoclosmatium globosum]